MGGINKFGVVVSIVVVVIMMMSDGSMGNKNFTWNWPGSNSNFNYTNWFNKTQPRTKNAVINVGGSQNWQFGFNYSDWAIKNLPFYINDTLVFKYDAPNATTHAHSVYMFSNMRSYMKCDLKNAKMVGNTTQGTGKGFKFVIKKWQPHYFGCGERNGLHCTTGQMKFAVMPMFRPFWPLKN